MIEIYLLKKNVQRIGKVQKASMGSTGYGFENTHGLFGSAEWWQQVESGKLQTHTISGIITRAHLINRACDFCH
ncbi:MAG TPA: hypothetical protein VE344_06665 [Methylomirabilota bacterium]|nr:hypothetical protein [Methylomirabilota bacterium]